MTSGVIDRLFYPGYLAVGQVKCISFASLSTVDKTTRNAALLDTLHVSCDHDASEKADLQAKARAATLLSAWGNMQESVSIHIHDRDGLDRSQSIVAYAGFIIGPLTVSVMKTDPSLATR